MANASDPPEVKERRRIMGDAIRRARGEMSQYELGDRLGVPQSCISRWEHGRHDLTYEQVRRLEVELLLNLGTIAVTSGYVSPRAQAMSADPVARLVTDSSPEAHRAMNDAIRLGFATTVTASPRRDARGNVRHEWVVMIHPDAVLRRQPPAEPT